MKVESYNHLYISETAKSNRNDLVWVSKHWSFLYRVRPKGKSERLDDYSIVWFDSMSEYEDFFLNTSDIFDISFEFSQPSVLVKTKYLSNCNIFTTVA